MGRLTPVALLVGLGCDVSGDIGSRGRADPAGEDSYADGAEGEGSGTDPDREGVEEEAQEEVCDGQDNDLDGGVDEGCGCEPGQQRSCYPGAPEHAERGICSVGSQTCRTSFEFASWEDCVGFTLPEDETCGDGLDNDCDGAADEDCGCTPGETRACFPSAVELIGVGICRQGMETCLGGGDDWGSCEGLQLSEAERCGDGLDNDCDGTADEGFDVGVPCDGADADLCREGTLVCTADATATECDDPGTDDAEECNGLDDDCDGAIDEDAQCGPEEICRQGGCVSILVTATVGCGGGTMTADDVCAGEGFAGASEACGYWWGQCAGPGACPGGWTGVDCEGYSGFQDCAGSEFDAHPYGWSIVERCGSGQTSFSPDDFLACDGWNPGWTVRARCEP